MKNKYVIKENIVLLSIQKHLPYEICCLIYSFILTKTRCLLQKKEYISSYGLYNPLSTINSNKQKSYFRHIVRNDYDFIFRRTIIQNQYNWMKHNKYSYKNDTYSTFLTFIHEYAIQNNAQKIKTIISEYYVNKKKHNKPSKRGVVWNT